MMDERTRKKCESFLPKGAVVVNTEVIKEKRNKFYNTARLITYKFNNELYRTKVNAGGYVRAK